MSTVKDRPESPEKKIRVKKRSSFRRSRIPPWLRITVAVLLASAGAALAANLIYYESKKYLFSAERGVSATDLFRKTGKEVLRVALVYSDKDGWGQGEAEYLAGRMSGYTYISPNTVADGSYSADGWDLTVRVGHTSGSSESYLDAYSRIGSGGYEITHSENGEGQTDSVTILAFDAGGAREGCVKFADYFLTLGSFRRAFTKLYTLSRGTDLLAGFIRADAGDDGAYRLLVFSQPDAGAYTLRAIGAISAGAGADCVLYHGGAGCGGSREELFDIWNGISGVARESGSVWAVNTITNDELNGEATSLALDVLASVAAGPEDTAANPGMIAGSDGLGGIIITAGERPVGVVYAVSADAARDAETVSGRIKRAAAVLARESGGQVPSAALMPSIPRRTAELFAGAVESDSLKVYSDIKAFESEASEKLCGALSESGVSCFLFYGGCNSIGTLRDGDAVYALCGSIGFSNPGIGGQFALNNSLRGGVLITVDPDAAYPADAAAYFASQYDANKKFQ